MSKTQIQEGKGGAKSSLYDHQWVIRAMSSSFSQSLESLAANCSTLNSFSTRKTAATDSNRNNASDSCVAHSELKHWETGSEIEKDYRCQSLFLRHLFSQPGNVEYMEKVFTCVRQKLGDKMKQVNTNAMLWR